MPVAGIAAFVLMRWLGRPLPTAVSVDWLHAPLIFVVFFFGSAFEEVGWTGYATEPLQARYGVQRAGALIGVVWALWHVPPWWLGQGHTIPWIAGQFAATVVMRIIMGWIYARGGQSLFLAVVFHAGADTVYALFPNAGSHYDPTTLAVILALIAGGVIGLGRDSAIPSRD
jgi:membrane protease YdiL (CAAX protease family)